MPLSSNAPFNEFGHSMVLRHLEQLDLTLSGAGSGASGEGSTQDQSTGVSQSSGDSGGLPDLSGLATIDYVDQQDNDIYEYVDNAIAAIPSISYPISIANGGTSSSDAPSARNALGCIKGGSSTLLTSTTSATWTVPAGVIRAIFIVTGAGGGGGGGTASATSGGVTISGAGGGGGGGGTALAIVDVVPGESLTYSCGVGGSYAASYADAGTYGGNTDITIGSLTITGGAGSGGRYYGNPGAGGSGSTSGTNNRNATVIRLNGQNGDIGKVSSTIGGTVITSGEGFGGQPGVNPSSGTYGYGGNNLVNGRNGYIEVFY